MIPKIIHRTYISEEDIPEEFQKAIQETNYINKTWQYRFYDDKEIERFILTVYGNQMLKCYHKINPTYGAAKADFFRYLLMYAQGGLYLDLKSVSKIPLDLLLKDSDEYFLSHWRNKPYEEKPYAGMWKELLMAGMFFGEYQQWFILCRPGHPFLELVINKVLHNIQNYDNSETGAGATLKVTGPVAYSFAINPVVDKYPRTLVDIQKSIGLYYTCMPWNQYHEQTLKLKNHYSYSKEPLILR